MEESTLDNGVRAKVVERGNNTSKTVLFMKAIGKKILCIGKVE
jgi:hypothetical protein